MTSLKLSVTNSLTEKSGFLCVCHVQLSVKTTCLILTTIMLYNRALTWIIGNENWFMLSSRSNILVYCCLVIMETHYVKNKFCSLLSVCTIGKKVYLKKLLRVRSLIRALVLVLALDILSIGSNRAQLH